jgi:hypothetical protein
MWLWRSSSSKREERQREDAKCCAMREEAATARAKAEEGKEWRMLHMAKLWHEEHV